VPGPGDEPVLALNGDTFVELEVAGLARKHRETAARLVLAAVQVPDGTRYGEVEIGADGAVLQFRRGGRPSPSVVNAGAYWGLRKDLVAMIPAPGECSFEEDVLPRLVGHGLYAVVETGAFVDIGVPDGYRSAEVLLRSGKRSPAFVRARAPLRLSFAGGGTDVSPYCDERGGAVLSATFNKYVHVALLPNTEGRVGLHSLDYQTSVHYDITDAFIFDGRLDLIKACIQRLYPERSAGFDIQVHADAPPGSGAGASSALVVAVLAALRAWLRLPMTEYELAETAFAVERCDLQISGAGQEH
jgi:hypothetical protein